MFRTAFQLCILLATILPVMAEESPFRWSAKPGPDRLEVQVSVPRGASLSWESIRFAVTDAGGASLAPISAPAPREEDGVPVLTAGEWRWDFRGRPPFRATVNYQGCVKAPGSNAAFCLMPAEEVLLPRAGTGTPSTDTEAASPLLPETLRDFEVTGTLSGSTDAAGFLRFLNAASAEETGLPVPAASGFLWMALMAVLGGIALNLTPCVLPMIPINLAILGAGQDTAGKSGFFRGLSYGCGIAAAYGILGAAVILGGARFGSLNAMPWFNFAVAALFFLLATAAAGVLPLDFTRFGRVRASRLPGGALAVAFLMGTVAALLAGACVAPVVISVLIFSAERYQGGNGFALFLPLLLGVGMGLPWPLAGAGLGVLPRPGKYMVWIKYTFAALIAAAGFYYAGTGWSLLHHDPEAEFRRLEKALLQSRETCKPLLLDLWAGWCKNCKAMETGVLSRPEVKNALKDFVVCKFRAEDLNDPRVRALLDAFQLPGLPGFVILRAK